MEQKATLSDGTEISIVWDELDEVMDAWTIGKLREEAQKKQAVIKEKEVNCV